MTTRVIGIREFRQNMGKLHKEARKKKLRFIVMNHSVPVFDVQPIVDQDRLEDTLLVEKYGKEIEESLEQAREGKVYTLEHVMKEIRTKKKA